MSTLLRAARGAISALACVGVAAYAAAALATVADVVGRPFGFPIVGVVDLVQLFVMAGAWLVMPYAFMVAAHVSVDFLTTRMPSSARRTLNVCAAGIAFGLMGLMLWQGFSTFRMRTMFGDTSQQLGIPIAWYWYPLLAGMALTLPAILLWLVSALREDDHG